MGHSSVRITQDIYVSPDGDHFERFFELTSSSGGRKRQPVSGVGRSCPTGVFWTLVRAPSRALSLASRSYSSGRYPAARMSGACIHHSRPGGDQGSGG